LWERNKGENMKAIIMIVGILFLAFRMEGQLPDELPIGSQERMLECVITNDLNAPLSIQYTNAQGNRAARGFAGTGGSFPSYAIFQEYIVTNTMKLIAWAKTNALPGTGILLDLGVTPPDYITYFDVHTNIGTIEDITEESIRIALRHPRLSAIPLNVPGLSEFKIEVDSVPPYTYTWRPGTTPGQQVDGRFPEWTRQNQLLLSRWYSIGSYKARFTVTAGGVSRTYTQFGNRLVAPTCTLGRDSMLKVYLTPGSETTIEYSSGLPQWEILTQVNWSSRTNVLCVEVGSTPDPVQFFRAYSR